MTTIQSTGELLTAADQVRAGERLVSELAAGRVESDVVASGSPVEPAERESGARARRAKSKGKNSTDQPTLFGDGASDGQEER